MPHDIPFNLFFKFLWRASYMKLLIAAMRFKYTFDLTKNVPSTMTRKLK